MCFGCENHADNVYDEYKKCILTTKIKINKLCFIPWIKNIKITTIRKMMQNIGSVMKKYFGQDFWVNLWVDKVLKSKCDVVCTDIRFVNEILKAMSLNNKGYNVTFIWVCYKNADFDNILKQKHESEALSQFIYYNQEKYGLHDLCEIKPKVLKQIISDFKNEQAI